MAKMKVGAQLYTCRRTCQTIEGLADTLRKLKKIGYNYVQISGIGAFDPKQVAQVLADEGLQCCCTHMAWDRFMKNTAEVIEIHQLWKCKHPAIGGLPGEYYSEAGLKRFLSELPPVAEKLLAAGMDFSYHNHNHELAKLGATTWLDALYAKSDPRHLKAELDTYWIQAGGGDPAEWIARLAGREPLLHLKDMTVNKERKPEFAEIGEGNLNWPRILKAAESAGVEFALVEQDETYGRDPLDCLAVSYRNLKAMGAAF